MLSAPGACGLASLEASVLCPWDAPLFTTRGATLVTVSSAICVFFAAGLGFEMFTAGWCSGFSGSEAGAELICVGTEVIGAGAGLSVVAVDGATGCATGAGVGVEELCFVLQP